MSTFSKDPGEIAALIAELREEHRDLDEAIAWAAKIPFAEYGAIEIRPLWTPGELCQG